MKCTNCSEQISRTTKFCPECGTKVEIPEKTPPLELSVPVGSSLRISEMVADIQFQAGSEFKVIIDGPEDVKATVDFSCPADTAFLTAEIIVTDESMPYSSGRGFNSVDDKIYYSGKRVDLTAKLSVTIIVPSAVSIEIENVVGDVTSSCTLGDFTSDSVYGEVSLATVDNLSVDASGVSEVRVQKVLGDADVDGSGMGDVHIVEILGDLDASISGSCALYVNDLKGACDASLSGTGTIHLAGESGKFKAKVSGTGSIYHNGIVTSVDAKVSGVGSIRVSKCTGNVKKKVSGVGSIVVG